MATVPSIELFKLKSHAENDLFLAFLKERQAIESKYAEDLNVAVQKYKPLCIHRPNVDKFLDFTSVMIKDHAQIAKFLLSTTQLVERHITTERKITNSIYITLSTQLVPARPDLVMAAENSKELYMKKSIEMSGTQKSYESVQELQEITQAYRDDVVELERNRSAIMASRENTRMNFDHYEMESFKLMTGCYRAYAKSIDTMSKNKLKAAEVFTQSVAALKGYRLDEVHFENFWPIPQNVYFEHFESGSPLKDLVFGVPLSFTFRNQVQPIPHFLKCAINQIDKRGLDIEGIYRVGPKNSDRDKARIELELDIGAFCWETVDIHILTGLIKAFFRELPEPLFPFNRDEKLAYNSVADEGKRIAKLKAMLKIVPKNVQDTLKLLVEHLDRVGSHSDKNKMNIENLSLIFSALLFDRPIQVKATSPPTKESSGTSWFKSSKKEKEKPVERPSINQSNRASYLPSSAEGVAEAFKNDLVLPDMVNNIAILFATADTILTHSSIRGVKEGSMVEIPDEKSNRQSTISSVMSNSGIGGHNSARVSLVSPRTELSEEYPLGLSMLNPNPGHGTPQSTGLTDEAGSDSNLDLSRPPRKHEASSSSTTMKGIRVAVPGISSPQTAVNAVQSSRFPFEKRSVNKNIGMLMSTKNSIDRQNE